MNWKHILAIILTAAVWIAWGLGQAGVLDPAVFKSLGPIVLLALGPVWTWLGVTSPQMPPMFGGGKKS